jgi:hypothetical protein
MGASMVIPLSLEGAGHGTGFKLEMLKHLQFKKGIKLFF